MLRGTKQVNKKGIFSNYCGLGGYGVPQHITDKICQEHDQDYDHIIRMGKNPYRYFNWADQKMLTAMENTLPSEYREVAIRLVAKAMWNVKKALASDDLSLLEKPSSEETPPRKRRHEFQISPEGRAKMVRLHPSDVPIRRRPSPVDDGDVNMEDDSSPAPESMALVASDSSGTRGVQHGETPIYRQPVSKRKPWADTEQVVMTYYNFHGTQTITAANPVAGHQWRLNSIYDCQKGTASFSDGEPAQPPVADSADATVETPTWRSYYAQFYNYWTVLSARYRIRVYVKPAAGDEGARDLELMAYVYHHGAQTPPKYSSTGPNVAVIHQHRREHDGMYYFPVRYTSSIIGSNQIGDLNNNACSGAWYPGSIKHEVAEDELKQNWHRMTEVPPTPEMLTILLQKSPTNIYSGDVTFRCEITLEYTVQLKDLKRDFQYPHAATNVPAIAGAFNQVN